jgi:hypothetical protein
LKVSGTGCAHSSATEAKGQLPRTNLNLRNWFAGTLLICFQGWSNNEGQMKVLTSQRFLTIYSAVLTITFAITQLSGFLVGKTAMFDQINVHRINVVEPDGT